MNQQLYEKLIKATIALKLPGSDRYRQQAIKNYILSVAPTPESLKTIHEQIRTLPKTK